MTDDSIAFDSKSVMPLLGLSRRYLAQCRRMIAIKTFLGIVR